MFLIKFFKAVPKNNPWMHSPKIKNKKAVLMAAVYFKVTTL